MNIKLFNYIKIQLIQVTRLFRYFKQKRLFKNIFRRKRKMVNTLSFQQKIQNDPIRNQMQRDREVHARRQEHDYSHVFRYLLNYNLNDTHTDAFQYIQFE